LCLPHPPILRDSHEPVRHPPPLAGATATDTAPAQLRTLAAISDSAVQRRWHAALDRMMAAPGADVDSLQRVRSWITHGVTIDLESSPSVQVFDNTPTVLQHADDVRTRIHEYIAFNAVVRLPPDHPCPFGIQPLHVIIKPQKKARIVIDLSRNLNDNLVYEYFSYSSVLTAVDMSTPGCWYSKLDLSNCFLSFPLHPSALPYFIFRFEGELYQFTSMPFGLSSAPRICTMLLSVLQDELHHCGVSCLVRYLDDFLVIEADCDSAKLSLMTAQQAMSDFGLVVNRDKTEGPSQRITFLGILLDSAEQTLACTEARLDEIRSLLSSALQAPSIRVAKLLTLIGKLQFAATVLPGARPFLRRVIDLRHDRLASFERHPTDDQPRRHHFAQQRASLRVTRGFRDDLRFWQAHLSTINGRQRWRSARAAPFVFATDASLQGFGYYLESLPSAPARVDLALWPGALLPGHGFSGLYSPEEAELHTSSSQMTTWCELFAVFAALCTYRPVLRDCCVLFRVDNQCDVEVLRRQRTRSPRLAPLLREIYTIAIEQNLDLWAVHRAGVDNTLADFLSRPALHGGGDGAAITHAWARTHPSLSAALRSVSVVHSHQFMRPTALPQ
jgi:hypothetical protein